MVAGGTALKLAIKRYDWNDVARRYEILCQRLSARTFATKRPSGRRRRTRPSDVDVTGGNGMTAGVVLVAHPSPDLYGADLQLLQSIAAMISSGRRVVVAVPSEGPLNDRIRHLGAEVEICDFPVLRKAALRPAALGQTAMAAAIAVPRLLRLIKRVAPQMIYVNTVTLPWWLFASRLAGVPVVAHLHEAETDVRPSVARLLLLPLRAANKIIVISEAVRSALVEAHPGLADRTQLIYNGVPGPDVEPAPAAGAGPTRLIVIGRLSPRKAPHLVLEAAALLRSAGVDVEVELAGSVFPSYEAYEAELQELAARPELSGHVRFAGHRSPIWPALAAADIVVQPSSREPFGNAVVEGMLAMRPVVAADAQGHRESVIDGSTGLLVTDADATSLAGAIRRLVDDPAQAADLARTARAEAQRRFSVDRYAHEVIKLVDSLAGVSPGQQTMIKERLLDYV